MDRANVLVSFPCNLPHMNDDVGDHGMFPFFSSFSSQSSQKYDCFFGIVIVQCARISIYFYFFSKLRKPMKKRGEKTSNRRVLRKECRCPHVNSTFFVSPLFISFFYIFLACHSSFYSHFSLSAFHSIPCFFVAENSLDLFPGPCARFCFIICKIQTVSSFFFQLCWL